jgi:signal transduction histidine kinase
VFVDAIKADKKQYPLVDLVRLPAMSRDVEIDYTALSFPIPERVRFRYRLDGWDKDWQDASTRRQAFYTNLRPGSYRFHVIACNGDGLWNDTGATLDFSIAPRYYQTAWFQILCGLVLILLAWLLYLLRLKQATARIQERLGARLEERERIARELHDTLLQGVQGLMLRFQGIMKTLPADQPTHKMMNDALDRADELMLQARQGVKDIRAAGMAESDLPDMLKSCAEDLRQDHAASIKLTFAGTPRPLDVTVCAEVYRIAREAMTNAYQHSGAPNIEVDVTYESDYFRVSVRDDGQGIEPRLLSIGKAGHWGLSGMRERAEKIGGRLRILSQRATGTEVELTVPGRLAYAKTVSPSLWDKIKRWNSKEEDY